MTNNEFIYLKPKNNKLIVFLFLTMILIVVYYICTKYTYDKKEIIGLNECNNKECQIKITLNYQEIKILDQNPKIIYQNKEYIIKDITYNDAYLNNNIPVSDITIITEKITDNNIIDFKITYNRERIINKIKNIIERN